MTNRRRYRWIFALIFKNSSLLLLSLITCRYGDFREASSREITLDATFEAFTVMMRAACHLKLNLTPESAVHTLQASKMYLIEKLERYCADYLYGLKDCTQILQAMTAAAKSCFCFVQELHRHYWTNILLQSSKVLASPAFQVAHGLIIDQLIKLDEFDVNEDDLWSCLVAWSANAVRQPEILGPFANTTEEVVKRSKTEGQESGAHEVAQQTAILRLMSQHIRFGAMTKEKFFDQARVHLTHEQNYEVIEHFWLGRTPQRVRASTRAGLVSEPEPVTVRINTQPADIKSADALVCGLASCDGRWTPKTVNEALFVRMDHDICLHSLELIFAPEGEMWMCNLTKGGLYVRMNTNSTTIGRKVRIFPYPSNADVVDKCFRLVPVLPQEKKEVPWICQKSRPKKGIPAVEIPRQNLNQI